ncbi:hypothetical protein ACFQGT_13465 [Natrialbaceae archaeon GCM10025810]|uniref:DUF7260 family protein n=1 Tax=Halovalidus salilacus TaxID=3075124 RepID=UPI003616AC10
MTDGATTAIDLALERVAQERTTTRRRIEAFEAFESGVRELSPATAVETAAPRGGPPGGSPAQLRLVRPLSTERARARKGGSSADGSGAATAANSIESTPDRRARVRRLFAETILPHSTEEATDDPLERVIAVEFTEDVATALTAPAGRFTPELKSTILERIAHKRRRAVALERALRAEARSLRRASEPIDEIVDWLRATAERSLVRCDFDDLRAKHERLESFRDRLRSIAVDRQDQLHRRSGATGSIGVRHRTLCPHLYGGLSSQYPVLATTARLYGICAGCQRSVRDHLTRRV